MKVGTFAVQKSLKR